MADIQVTKPGAIQVTADTTNYQVTVQSTTTTQTVTPVGITNTDQLIEGSTNLFYTDARADARVAAGIAVIDYPVDSVNGETGDVVLTTTDIAEGTNQYYTTDRANTDFDTRLATKTTTNLTEGTNLYYTTNRANSDFDTRLATKTSDNLNEGNLNQYFTTTRARQAISVSDLGGDGSASYDNTTGVITYTGPSATEVRAHFSAGTGVSITDGSIAIGQAVGTTDNVTFNDGVFNGNLTVNGTTVTLNTETLNVEDNKITLNYGVTGAPTLDSGVEVERGSDNNVELRWNEAVDRWETTTDGIVYTALPNQELDTNSTAEFAAVQTTGIQIGVAASHTIDNSGPETTPITIAEDVIVAGELDATTVAFTTDKVTEGTTNLYYTTTRFDDRLATKTTTDLAEGTNLYYTTTRFDDRLATKTTTDLAEGTNLYYTSTRANSDFDTRLATKSTTDLAEGTNLYYTSTRANSDFDTRLATKSTTDLAEGTNLYYTTTRFDDRLATKTTTDLAEGTNLYYTTTRFDDRLATKTTTDLAEGTNLYYTTTRFDDRLATKTTDNLTEGSTNKYYLDSRARTAISVTDTGGDGSLSYDNSTGVITYTGPSAAEVRAHFSGGTGVTITDGVVAIGQPVGTASDVDFRTVISERSIAAGGSNLGSNGEFTTFTTLTGTGTTTGSIPLMGLTIENATAGFAAGSAVIDHGQNRPGGTSTTGGAPTINTISTRGTASAPTASGANDLLGSLQFSGHDGVRSLGTDVNGASLQLLGVAAQPFVNDGTYTTAAGVTTILRSQPSNLRVTATSRQQILTATYTGGTTNTPPTQNLFFNTPTMATQYDAAGNSILGHGRQDVLFYHPTISLLGVPSQSTGNADNSTLPGSNVINFYTSRQSAWPGRRDVVENNDTLASIRVFGQTLNNTGAAGSQAGTIDFTAAENFSGTRRGSRFTLQTGEIGTNTLSNRISLDSDNFTVSSTRTRFSTPGAYGGEISMKAGILNGATDYDKTTELSVTALTTDGSRTAIYETKTNRFDGTNYSATQTGDALGRFTFLGNYSSGTSPATVNAAGNITVKATENWTDTASGASMQINVNKTGTNDNVSVLDVSAMSSIYRSDVVSFKDSNNVSLPGGKIDYSRVYGQWEQDGPVTPAAANTSYVFPIGTAIDTNIASVVSTSQITPGAAGKYNLQFSLQWANADNTEHTFYVWLRKNGVNVANSAGDITCLKSAKGISGWNYIVSSANATDYWELAYQVTDTDVTFPYVAAQGTAPNDIPAAPALITTLTPVGA
jgi:hypothetical protein